MNTFRTDLRLIEQGEQSLVFKGGELSRKRRLYYYGLRSIEVSTTCGSGWVCERDEGRGMRDEKRTVLSSLHPSSFIPHPFYRPPATAGGTDLVCNQRG